MLEKMQALVEAGQMTEEAYRQLGETLVQEYRRPTTDAAKLELARGVISDLWRVWNSETSDEWGQGWYELGRQLFRRGLAEEIGVQEPEESEPDADELDESGDADWVPELEDDF